MIRSTSQLAEMRASLLHDVALAGDPESVVEDFVAAVNEIVAAVVADGEVGGPAIDVRWRRQTHPQPELYAEVRNTMGTPMSLLDDGIPARLLQHFAERVDFDERIGGSVITVRCRV